MPNRFVLETQENLKSRLEILKKTLETSESAHKPQVNFLTEIEPLVFNNSKLSDEEKRQIITGLRLAMVKDIEAKTGTLQSYGTTHFYLLDSLGIDYKKGKAPTKHEVSIYLDKAAKFVTELAMVTEVSSSNDKKFKESPISNNNYQDYWRRILETSLEAKVESLEKVSVYDKERKVNELGHNLSSAINQNRSFDHLQQVFKTIQTEYRAQKNLKVKDETRVMQLNIMKQFIDILVTHDLNSTAISPSKQSQATKTTMTKTEALIKAEIAMGFLLIIQADLKEGSKLKKIINEELDKVPNVETSKPLTPEEKAHYIRQARAYLVRRSQSNVLTKPEEALDRQWNAKEKQILSDVDGFDIKAFINTAYKAFYDEMCLVIAAHQAQFKKPEVKDVKGSSWIPNISMGGLFGGKKAKAPEVVVPELATAEPTKT